jgi:ADP-heptose:LPS heptosyltransferase
LPWLAVWRGERPDWQLKWLVNSVWAPLLRGHPQLDGVLEFPRNRFRGPAALIRFWRWQQTLDWRPDLALDVQGLLRSAILARATGARRIIGYSDAREGAQILHHEVVDVRCQRSPHAVDRYLTVLGTLGLDLPSEVEFPLGEGTRPAEAPPEPEPFLALHPFSRGRGKSLTRNQVEQAVRGIDLPVWVVGRASESGLNLGAEDRNWLNRTSLPELIWILRRAQWVVSVDSGPMHLAVALRGLGLSALGTLGALLTLWQVTTLVVRAWVLVGLLAYYLRLLRTGSWLSARSICLPGPGETRGLDPRAW